MIFTIPSLYMCLLFIESVLSIGKLKQCRRKNRLITARKNDMYEIVDAINSQQIMIQCHYCFEKDDHNPKIWYKQVRPFTEISEELKLPSTLNPSLARVSVNLDHTLIIKNYSSDFDEGIYYCHEKNGEEAEYKFNYLIDTVVNVSDIKAEIGDSLGWKKYREKYLKPINWILKNLTYYKQSFHLAIMTEWEPWGHCIACGISEGQRRRRGKCRFHATKLKPSVLEARNFRKTPSRRQVSIPLTTTTSEDDVRNVTEKNISGGKLPIEQIFLYTPVLSCRSLQLSKSEDIPVNVSETFQRVPDYIQIQSCHGLCRKDGATFKLLLGDQAEEAPIKNLPKEDEIAESIVEKAEKEEDTEAEEEIHKTVELRHGDRLTLVCPGASASSVVTWKKNGKNLSKGRGQDSSPVDALGTLHIEAVGAEDAGSYACAVDGIEASVVGVDVEAPPFLEMPEFLRHNTYLGVVVALCLVVYCSGIVVAFTQRHRFHPPGYVKVDTVEDAVSEVGM